MTELLPPTVDDAIAEIERELRVRENVYMRLIATGRLTQERADLQQSRLRLALKLLHDRF